MRSVSLLVVLGASFARGVSLEQRDLESEDTSNIVERHDNGLFAAQHPLTQTDNPLVGMTSIGPNLEVESNNPVDQVVNSVETPTAQSPLSEKDNQANIHAILKRVPDYLTFNVPVYRSGFKTSLRTINIPVIVSQGTKAPVTVTKKVNVPVTVTVPVIVIKTITQFQNLVPTAFKFTNVPEGVTDEFLTFVYATVTRDITIYQVTGRGVYITLTSPMTVTVTEGVGPTVTVTRAITRLLTISAPTFLPRTTRTVALPKFVTARSTTNSLDSGLPRSTTIPLDSGLPPDDLDSKFSDDVILE